MRERKESRKVRRGKKKREGKKGETKEKTMTEGTEIGDILRDKRK